LALYVTFLLLYQSQRILKFWQTNAHRVRTSDLRMIGCWPFSVKWMCCGVWVMERNGSSETWTPEGKLKVFLICLSITMTWREASKQSSRCSFYGWVNVSFAVVEVLDNGKIRLYVQWTSWRTCWNKQLHHRKI
jgi:hypothetical protein